METNCTYCNSEHGNTDDHVPPKGFFQNPLPNDAQLITIPCCEVCRDIDQRHDGFIRNLFCSLFDTEAHQVIKNDVAFRRYRSLERDKKSVQQLVDSMVTADVHTPTGIYIGKAPAFNLDLPVINRFIERVCRAVIFDAFKLSYFQAEFNWQLKPISDAMLSNAPLSSKQRYVLDVFHYLVTPVSEKDTYWVVLTFYQNMRILGYLKKINQIIPEYEAV